MQWKCKSFEQKYHERKEWQTVFAWFPHKLTDGTVIWLDFVKRRATPVSLEDYGGMVYEYDHAGRVK